MRDGAALAVRGFEGVRRRCERVEDGLVADRAPPTARQPVGGRAQHPGHGRAVELRGVVRLSARLEEGRAVERPRCAPDRGHKSMSHGPQQFAGACLGGQLGEQRIHGPKADHEVVAVVAVAQHRVQAGQVRGMTLDHDTAPPQRCPDGCGIDASRARSAGALTVGRVYGRPTSSGRQRGKRAVRQPRGPFNASLDAVLLCS